MILPIETRLTFPQALALVLAHARNAAPPLASEKSAGLSTPLPLLQSVGRVLAGDVLAERDQPPFDRSTRDGFAVRAQDAASPLSLVGQVQAGQIWSGSPLGPHQAIEIMTGAPVPPGADAVVMLEHVTHSHDEIRLASDRLLRPGVNIVPRGAEARAGSVVVPSGTRISAAEIALAAACGRATLGVHPRPRVAIVATGDELVELDAPLGLAQIRNSNSYALAAMVSAAGGHPLRLEVARDLREAIRSSLDQARHADLILFSGGVSMGKYDLVEEVLAERGAEFLFTAVAMQPGKPVVFGRLPAEPDAPLPRPACFFFGLPGNPVSTQVTFHCFVEPLIRALSGERELGPTFVQATLSGDVPAPSTAAAGLTRFLPARLAPALPVPHVQVVPWQGSGDLAANARANCYLVVPEAAANTPTLRAGDTVTLLLRSTLLG